MDGAWGSPAGSSWGCSGSRLSVWWCGRSWRCCRAPARAGTAGRIRRRRSWTGGSPSARSTPSSIGGRVRNSPATARGSGEYGDPPAVRTSRGRGTGAGRAADGGAMMGGGYVLPGNGRRVDSLAAARHRAQLFADELGLRAGEVMQFANGFYAELRTADGRGATEVLVDPAGGGVAIEYGPAMMWNTSYGMHAGAAPAAAQISAADAARLAGQWLREQRRGLSVGEAEEFPGYFTLHTMRDGKITGMMSVNAYTGAVWYHTWHGRYIAMSEQ